MSAVRASPQTENDLRTRRRRLGVTQQDLAVAAGCSISLVRLLEGGYQPANSPSRERIEAVLTDLDGEATR